MDVQVQVSPFHNPDFSLAGLLLHGRWPESVREWSQVLVLAVFLGGTALGSFLVAERSRHLRQPLHAYALVEALLGVLGIVFHLLYRAAEGFLYGVVLPGVGQGTPSSVAIWSIAVLLILPQALLLGTTYPLMAAGVVRRRRGVPGRSIGLICTRIVSDETHSRISGAIDGLPE